MRLSTFWFPNYIYYIFSFLVFCGKIHSVINAITYIKREAVNPTQLLWKHDIFGLSKSDDCSMKYGSSENVNATECQCHLANMSTFLYSQKKCISNVDVQRILDTVNTGCPSTLLEFRRQSKDGPYYVINLRKGIDSQRTFFKDNKIASIQSSCIVYQVHYIDDLSGKMKQVSQTYFTVDTTNKKLVWQTGNVPRDFIGRVLLLKTSNCRVTFGWYNAVNVTNPCIVVKVQGILNNFPIAPSSTNYSLLTKIPIQSDSATLVVSLSTISEVNPTSSQHAISTHVGSSIKTSVRTNPTKTPRISDSIVAPTRTSTFVPVTSSAVTVPPSKPTDNKRQTSEQSSPVGAIVGSIMAVIVVAIIIVLIVIWKRRRKTPSEATNGMKKSDNPMYGKGNNEVINLSNPKRAPGNTDNELEYDYAAVDGDPHSPKGTAPGIYQSLTNDHNRESVYSPLERQQDNPNGYNKVERPLFKPARQGPIEPTYNVLEKPNGSNEDYLEPGVHIDKNKKPTPKQAPQNNEPVYNVLEGPNPEGEDEPEYNELEGPDEPEYNVLEDHDGQGEPDYNVLEDPDDNYDNAPVEGDIGHPSSRDNVGYASTISMKPKPKPKPGTKNEPVYAAPDGSTSEQTYQPLQIKAPDESVYQPLDRTSRVVPDDQPVYHVLESKASDA